MFVMVLKFVGNIDNNATFSKSIVIHVIEYVILIYTASMYDSATYIIKFKLYSIKYSANSASAIQFI